MKSIYSILIAILYCLICSCYTKQAAIKKFCTLDTAKVTITIHDTILIDSVQTDTVFNDTVDSVYITKDRLEIRYIKKFGKVYIQGKCNPIKYYYHKNILVEVPVDCPKESWFNQMILQAKWWLLLIIAILILVIYRK